MFFPVLMSVHFSCPQKSEEGTGFAVSGLTVIWVLRAESGPSIRTNALNYCSS